MRRAVRWFAASAAAVALLAPPAARALPPSVSVASAYYFHFVPGWDPTANPSYDPNHPDNDTLSQTLTKAELHITQGSRLLFVNADTFALHDIVAVHAYGETPLFANQTVFPSGDPDIGGMNFGQASFVEGVETLPAGHRYAFICGVHGDLMSGFLYVDPQ